MPSAKQERPNFSRISDFNGKLLTSTWQAQDFAPANKTYFIQRYFGWNNFKQLTLNVCTTNVENVVTN